MGDGSEPTFSRDSGATALLVPQQTTCHYAAESIMMWCAHRNMPPLIGREQLVSRVRLSLRLVGELNELEQAAKAMSGLPFQLWRKGVVYPHRVRAQPANVLILELAKW